VSNTDIAVGRGARVFASSLLVVERISVWGQGLTGMGFASESSRTGATRPQGR